ncbi:MAG: T9SS type A sorting domain-containing protein [candidate division Zixibacteria bacterium]|nr:T9SS type A sorting domain-containing protein [candidate division Zixibacteria bacterium]
MRVILIIIMTFVTMAATETMLFAGQNRTNPDKPFTSNTISTPAPDVICQGGDTIEDAFIIPSIPFSDSGTTVGYTDDYEVACPWEAFAPDVVYKFVADEDMRIGVSLCRGSDYDTKLFIIENDFGNIIGCDDDECYTPIFPHPWVSRLDNVQLNSGNTYYVFVDGYSMESGNYTIDIYECPSCEISVTPDGGPPIVPPGGEFGYTGYLDNMSPEQFSADVWIMLDVPEYGEYGPLRRYNNIPLQPFESLEAYVVQQVPNYAPLGSYKYWAYYGDYPVDVCGSSNFQFAVMYNGGVGDADNWNLMGEWMDDGKYVAEKSSVDCYPNPFNAITTISYQLPVSSKVNLDIYNVLGRRVETLINGNVEAGYHSVSWDASNYSSGVYFYKLKIGDKVITKRMTLLK